MRIIHAGMLLLFAVAVAREGRAQLLPRTQPEQVGFSTSALQQITPVLRSHVDAGEIPGFLAVVLRHGKIVYLDSAGFVDIAQKRLMRTDAVFRLFSMTKPVTAVAVMQLVERGRIRLTDPVAKYIPSFANTQVYAGGSAAQPRLKAPARPITIHDLLTHTAGLTYGFFGNTSVDSLYVAAKPLDANRSIAQFADTIAHLPLLFSPGTAWNYSVAMDVLGRVVEIASGKTLDRYFQDEIFTPLDMGSTSFHVQPAFVDRIATMYVVDQAGKLRATPAFDASYADSARAFFGGAGLLSTLPDYLRFAQALANGGELGGHRILRRGSVALMMQNHLPPALIPIQLFPDWPLGKHGFGYGGAIRVDSAAGIPGNAGIFRWNGYGSTFFWIDPKADVVAMLWTQLVPSTLTAKLDNEFQRLVYHALVIH